MKVGDIVTLKEEWRIGGVYYGPGVITMIDEGTISSDQWKSFRVQWNDDWSWHDPEHLEIISESR